MRPGSRVGLHRGEHGLLDRGPGLGRGADRRPAAVGHRRPHSQAALQSYDAQQVRPARASTSRATMTRSAGLVTRLQIDIAIKL
jgi:hypothetical protein